MKIAYVIEKMSDKGGMERIITDKMNYLAAHTAHEVLLILLWHDPKPLAYKLDGRIRVLHLNVPGRFIPMALWRFARIIRKEHPDITIYEKVMGAFMAAFSGWKGRGIFESHTVRHALPHQWVIDCMEHRIDAVVSLTEADSKEFLKAERKYVIPNFTLIHPDREADYSSHHCLCLARFTYEKNLQRMVRIWQKAVKAHPDWHLDIVGEGPDEEDIRHLIVELGVSESITIHKPTDNVLSHYLNSSIYLMTSRFEGMPMVLIEATTCGLPIVSVDCNYGPRHIVKDGETGFLTPYDDDEAMAEAIGRLMDDQELRRTMGHNAIQASSAYRPSHIMAQWLQLFNTLAR